MHQHTAATQLAAAMLNRAESTPNPAQPKPLAHHTNQSPPSESDSSPSLLLSPPKIRAATTAGGQYGCSPHTAPLPLGSDCCCGHNPPRSRPTDHIPPPLRPPNPCIYPSSPGKDPPAANTTFP